jgi:hypothetical protein
MNTSFIFKLGTERKNVSSNIKNASFLYYVGGGISRMFAKTRKDLPCNICVYAYKHTYLY